MPAKKSMEDLTDKQLESEWTKKAKELEKLKEELRQYSKEHQRRASVERARQVLAGFTDEDRAFLLQEAEAEGIESQEGTGEL